MTPLPGDPVRGVLFDYGDTLVTFERPVDALCEAYALIEATLHERLPAGSRVPPATVLIREVHDRVDAAVAAHEAAGGFDEIALGPIYADAYAEQVGAALDTDLVDELVRIEQRAWFAGVRPAPDAAATLRALRDRGLRVGLCSNAPYHAPTLRDQLEHVGLAPLLDSVTLSSDAGRRKPAPELFLQAAAHLGTALADTVHVGDRLREDVEGAHAAGLRAVWLTRRAIPGGGNGGADAVIHRLTELLPMLSP